LSEGAFRGRAVPRRNSFPYTNSVCPPTFQTATYYFGSTDEVVSYHCGQNSVGRYGRYDNPGWLRVERELAELECAEQALIFPSGMSAITSTFLAFCKTGDRLLYSGNSYRNVRNLFKNIFANFGVDAVAFSMDNTGHSTPGLVKEYDDRCKLIFLEVPSNPHLFLADIREIANYISKDTVLVVDSTFATPINMRPLLLGGHLVIHSCGKYLGGHDDLVGGAVAGGKDLIEKVRSIRDITGAICDPVNAALLERSLKTLELRMRALNENGHVIASWLEKHPLIARVYYPGLESHPHHLLARKQMLGFGGVVPFELKADRKATSGFIDKIKTAYMATNFGGTSSLIEQVAVFTFFKESELQRQELGIGDSLVRLSVGCGNPALLMQDLDSALSQTSGSLPHHP
jgi:cystathionine gamma-synthase